MQAGNHGSFCVDVIYSLQLGDAVMNNRVATRFAGGLGEEFLGGNADEAGASQANPAVSQPQAAARL